MDDSNVFSRCKDSFDYQLGNAISLADVEGRVTMIEQYDFHCIAIENAGTNVDAASNSKVLCNADEQGGTGSHVMR